FSGSNGDRFAFPSMTPGATSTLVTYYSDQGDCRGTKVAQIIKGGTSPGAIATLVPSVRQLPGADAAWTGSSYFVAWTKPLETCGCGCVPSTAIGEIAFVKEDGTFNGTIRPIPSGDATGKLDDVPTVLQVAVNGTSNAVLWGTTTSLLAIV